MSKERHLATLPGRGLRCPCGARADNFARCRACRAVVARCADCGPAIEKRESHCP